MVPQDLFPKSIRLIQMFFPKHLLMNSVVSMQETFSTDDSSMKILFVFNCEFHLRGLKVFCCPTRFSFVLLDMFGLPDLILTSTVPDKCYYIVN